MGFFNSNNGDFGDLAIAPKMGDGKIYKTVQLAALSVFLIAVTLLILEIFQVLKIGSTANGIIFSIGIIGLGGITALPWVRVFECIKDKRFKITAIVFLSLIGVCVILWIVCVWLIIGLFFKGTVSGTGSFNVIRATLIVSLQFIIASYIAMNVVKYRKELLPYQVMAGASMIYIDFYAILILMAITIVSDGVEFSKSAILLTNMWVHALLAVFIVLAVFPNVVFKRTDKKNLVAARNEALGNINKQEEATAPETNNTAVVNNDEGIAEKLQKIKSLLDNGLITQEEYDAKRAEILNSI